MITGDNPLTACHVAKELRMTRSKTPMVILTAPDKTSERPKFFPSFSATFHSHLLLNDSSPWYFWFCYEWLLWNWLIVVFTITFISMSRKNHTSVVESTSEIALLADQAWHWQSIDDAVSLPAVPNGGHRDFTKKFDLCLTGEVSQKHLARPKRKTRILEELNTAKYCSGGTFFSGFDVSGVNWQKVFV